MFYDLFYPSGLSDIIFFGVFPICLLCILLMCIAKRRSKTRNNAEATPTVQDADGRYVASQTNDSRTEESLSESGDFEEIFLRPVDIHDRAGLYVSAETKRRIAEVVHNLGGRRMSMTSYVENILRRHLALHRDEINRLHRKRGTRNIL